MIAAARAIAASLRLRDASTTSAQMPKCLRSSESRWLSSMSRSLGRCIIVDAFVAPRRLFAAPTECPHLNSGSKQSLAIRYHCRRASISMFAPHLYGGSHSNGAPHRAPLDNRQSVVLIFVTFVPSSDKSPIRPFSLKTNPRMGFPRVVASYWPPAPLDTTAMAESPPADHPSLLVK